MNANTRVAINAMATYGRTLLRMGLGLFSSRWVLQSLGEVDYGLMGVVGSLIVFVTFLNSVVSGACARFFAFSIGKNDTDDLIRWFNVGLSVHIFLAVVLVALGFPIGEWAINNFLNIPPERLTTAKYVFGFSLVSAFWTIASTPYISMYTATQNIAEFTLWEIASILINFGFVYWLTTYQGDAWLIYSGFTVGITVLLGIGKVLRARYIFPGCRIRFSDWKNRKRLKEMLSFSGWTLFGNLGYLARTQFSSILLNKYFPPVNYPYVNASYQIGGTLAGYTQSMSSSLMSAFSPQITTLAGANDMSGMVKTAIRASKFGTFLTLLFAIPLSIEVDYLLELWLGNPPLLAGAFCKIVLIQMVLDNLTFGSMSSIMASGNVKWYQITTGSLCMLSVPIAWYILHLGGSPVSVSWVIAGCMAACSIARLFFSRAILGMKVSDWLKNILFPLTVVTLGAYFAGELVVHLIASPSFLRICITSCVSCIVMFVLAWFLLFDQGERSMILKLLKKITPKLRRTN